jgi:hypothetical protein
MVAIKSLSPSKDISCFILGFFLLAMYSQEAIIKIKSDKIKCFQRFSISVKKSLIKNPHISIDGSSMYPKLLKDVFFKLL